MAKILKIDFTCPESAQEVLSLLKGSLEQEKAIVFPTDTLYGLGTNPFKSGAIENIFRIKNRPPDKPLLVLLSDRDQLNALVETPSTEAETLMDHFWPGPLTIICKAQPHLPAKLTADSWKLGIRLPGNEFCRQLIAALGHPLTAPSANISGEETGRTALEVNASLGSLVPYIVDGGPSFTNQASTLVDTTVFPPILLREGLVTKTEMESVLNSPLASP